MYRLTKRLAARPPKAPAAVPQFDTTVQVIIEHMAERMMKERVVEFEARLKEKEREALDRITEARRVLLDAADEAKTHADRQLAEHIATRAMEIQGIQGERGEEGPQGPVGPYGAQGPQGIQGERGEQGDSGSPDTPEQVVEKINHSSKKINPEQINGLKEAFATRTGKSGGGGMGNVVTQSTAISSATTTITLTHNVASKGKAIWLNYNGQQQAYDTHFTVSGKTITLLFTPDDNTFADILYIRS